MNQTDLRAQTKDRIQQLSSKLLDAAERVLDSLNPETATPVPPVAVARRQLANTLRLSKFCANRACRRTHACRGEPLHCLQAVVPILPPDAFDGLLRKQSARRRRRK